MPDGRAEQAACRQVFGELRADGPEIVTTDRSSLRSDPRAPARGLDALLAAWLPLTYALNAINRSMGAEDLYPFVLAPEVQRKLAFIDARVQVAAASDAAQRWPR